MRGQTQRQVNWMWPICVLAEEDVGRGGQLPQGPGGGAFRGGGSGQVRRNWPNKMSWKGPLSGGTARAKGGGWFREKPVALCMP